MGGETIRYKALDLESRFRVLRELNKEFQVIVNLYQMSYRLVAAMRNI